MNGSLLREALVDELLVYLAPRLLGDTARAMAELAPLGALALPPSMEFCDVTLVGGDLRVMARFKQPD